MRKVVCVKDNNCGFINGIIYSIRVHKFSEAVKKEFTNFSGFSGCIEYISNESFVEYDFCVVKSYFIDIETYRNVKINKILND